MAVDQKAPTQQPQPPESEQEELLQGTPSPEEPKNQDQEEDSGGEASPPDSGEATPPENGIGQPQGHKRQGGYQRQIARLERQNQELLQALQRVGGQPSVSSKEKTAEEKAAELFERMVDQRIQQRDVAREQQAQAADFQRRAAEARSSHEDWDDAISTLDIPTVSPLGQALLTSEHGPEIMYQLATNPAELARLSALPPFAAAREIGKLEARISGATPQNTNSAKRPPAPPSSVGGSPAKSTRSLETLPISEYKKAYRSGRR